MPSTSPWCSMSWRCCCCRPPFTHNYVSTMGPLWKDQLLSHWGRVTHICVIKLSIIGSDNGLSPGRRQAIIWTSAETLLISALRTNFSEIFSDIQMSWFKKIHLKMSSENGGHFVSASMCYGLKCEVVSYEGWNKPNSLWMLYIVVYMIIWMYFLVYYSLRNSTWHIAGHSVHQWAYLWWSDINFGRPKKYVIPKIKI